MSSPSHHRRRPPCGRHHPRRRNHGKPHRHDLRLGPRDGTFGPLHQRTRQRHGSRRAIRAMMPRHRLARRIERDHPLRATGTDDHLHRARHLGPRYGGRDRRHGKRQAKEKGGQQTYHDTGANPSRRKAEEGESAQAKYPAAQMRAGPSMPKDKGWLVAMDDGQVLATGTPAELLTRTQTESLEAAFIALLPEDKKRGHAAVVIPPLQTREDDIAIEARELTMRFGDFVAVDHVNFRIRRGEIFGFLGSNGCGKSTTMKMLTGLLPASEGRAWLFGHEVDSSDIATRRRVGYMSQGFSLYGELTVLQNLVLHAQLFDVPAAEISARVEEMLERFGLREERHDLPDKLPLGLRQRLSLAVAMVHKPELLILDEPTSGVDA